MATITDIDARALGLPEGVAPANVVEATESGSIVLPEGIPLSACEFEAVGDNLVITAPDGTVTVVRGYFGMENPPELVSPGGGEMSGDMVAQLAGPVAPGQYAQAGEAIGTQPIGTVENVSGTVMAIRADGTRIELQVGDPVYQGDILETSEDGAIGVILADETTFSMAEAGRMVLDEMVYDPGTQEGSINFSIVQGVFTFVSGQVAKTDPDAMTLSTPVATIGIRGTQVGIEIPDGENMRVVLMEEGDGFVGEVVVMNESGVEVMNSAFDFTTVSGFNVAPSAIGKMSQDDLVQLFASNLQHIPTDGNNANHYGLQGNLEEGQGTEDEELGDLGDETGSGDDGEDAELGDIDESDDLGDFETAAGEEEGEEEELGDIDLADQGEDIDDLINFETAAGGEEDNTGGGNDDFSVTGDYTSPTGFTPSGYSGPGSVPSSGGGSGTGTDGGTTGGGNPVVGATGGEATNAAATVGDPVAFAMNEDGSLEISEADLLANASDDDGDSLSVVNLTADGGTLTDNGDGTWTFEPADDFNGTVNLSYDVSDGTETTPASASIDVAAVGDAAEVATESASGAEDSAIALDISASVPDSTETVASITISGVPTGASLSLGTDNGDGSWTLSGTDLDSLGDLTITPPTDDNADFTLSVAATSTDGTTGDAVDLPVTVSAVADTTLSTSDATGDEDTAIALTIAPNVAGGESIASVTISGVPSGATLSAGTDNGNGTWTLSGDDLAGLTITPDTDDNTDFQLGVSVDVTDGDTTHTLTDTVDVTVNAVNDGPVASDSAASGTEDVALNGQLTASDVDGDALTFSLAEGGAPAHGTVTVNPDGSFSYTPDADYNGGDSFTYLVDDGAGGTTTATVSLTIDPENDDPVAVAGVGTVDEDGSLNGQLVASDIDSESLTFGLAEDGGPEHGSVTINPDGSYTYTPDADYNGEDSFTFAVSDGAGGTATQTVSLTVNAVGDAAQASATAASGAEDTAIALDISASVPDSTETVASITISGVPAGASLSLGTDNGDGSWTLSGTDLDSLGDLTITPPTNSNADFTLSVAATSTDGTTGDAVDLPVTVSAVADTTLSTSDATGDEDTAIALAIAPSVAGGESIASVTISGVPSGATLSAGTDNGDGTWTLSGDDLAGLTITPDADDNSDFQLGVSVDVTDGDTTHTLTDTVDVTVNAVNDGPVASDSAASGTEDLALNGQLTASDVDGDALTFSLAEGGAPAHGSVTVNPDGSFTYTPDADYNGGDSFTYLVDDGQGGTTTATVSLTIDPENDDPVAVAGVGTVDEDGSLNGQLVASDIDSESLTFGLAEDGGPEHGSVTINPDGSYTYTPDADYNGEDSFTFAVSDGAGGTATQTVSLTVNAVGDAAEVATESASGAEDSAIALDISASVPDSTETVASITISGVPTGASLSLGTDNGDGSWTLSGTDLDNLGDLTITPPTDDNADFTLSVAATSTDGTTGDAVDLPVTVSAVADTTLSTSDATGDEDTAIALTIAPSVAGGESIASVTISGVPAGATLSAGTDNGNGTWTLSEGDLAGLTITPDADDNSDFQLGVSVDVTDGDTTHTLTDTVDVTVNAVNDGPVASDSAASGTEDVALNGQLTASDVDGDDLTFSLAEGGAPAHGTVTVNPDGSFTYTPDADYNGEDSFTFEVSDGAGGTATQTVSLTVNAVGDAAEVATESASGVEDTAIALDISASVPDSTETVASITISGVPAGASLSLGTDNGNGSWTLSGTDLDSLGDLTITPPTDDNADFTLSVAATSTDGTTGTAVDLPVSVSAVADTTLSTSDATGDEDTAIALTIAPNVAGGESIASVTISGVPSGATLSAGTDNGDGSWTLSGDDLAGLTITPDADDNSDFQLGVSVDVTDGDTTHTLTDTVEVTVNAVNDGPVTSDSAASGTEDTALNGQLSASDVDGDSLTFSLAEGGAPAHGSVTVNPDGSFTYTPDADYNGGDSFTYLVDDGAGGTTTATVSLTIDPENDDPVAVAGVGTLDEDGSLNGQLVASDIDSESLTFGLAEDGGPEHGSVTINPDGSYTYTPDADYNGEDSFTFAVSDGAGGTATQTVSLTVNAVGDAAEASATAASGAEDTVIALDISASVPDSTETVDSITISGVPTGASLSLGTDNGDGSWTLSGTDLDSLGDLTITPPTDDNADFTLSVAATSTDGTTGDAVDLPVTVSAVADTTLSTSDATGDEDTAIALTIAPSVAGGESIASVTISGVPSGATLSAGTDNGNGTWTLSGDDLAGLTITPDTDDNTDFQLGVSVDVTDGDTTHTLTDTVDVTVNAIEDAPDLGTPGVAGDEDTAIPLSISAEVPGTEELASIVIDNIPAGATLSVGTSGLTLTGNVLTGSGEGGIFTEDDLQALADGALTITPAENSNDDFDLTITATSTDGGSSAATLPVSVAAVDDAPDAGAAVSFDVLEDGSLVISEAQLLANASDIDSTDLSVVNLTADGGTLTDNGNGTWTFEPAADFNGTVTLSYGVSDGTTTVPTTASIDVEAVGDAAEVSAEAASGAEDTAIVLDISASVPGSTETVASITISGVPSGASLSLGTDNGNGSWTLSGDDLDNLDSLTITPPTDDDSDFTLSVAATSTDGTTGDSVDLPVSVSAVADTTIAGDDVAGDEDTAIALTITPNLAGGETISFITISGVPAGATLSAGTDNGDGTWTLSEDDLDGLTITPPADSDVDFTLEVNATLADGSVTATDSIGVEVAQVTEDVNVNFRVSDGNTMGPDWDIDSTVGADIPDPETFGETETVTYDGSDIEVTYDDADTATVSLTDSWNSVKNIEADSDVAADVTLENFVHTDVTLGDGGDSTVTIDGAKRGDITTGDGDDTIDIDAQTNNDGWSNLFDIDTGAGDDTITVTGDKGVTDVEVTAGEGDDTITVDGDYDEAILDGGAGDDTIVAGGGDDTLIGGEGDDTISAGGDDDVLTGGSGDDYMDGGDQFDVAVFSGSFADYAISVNDETGVITVVGPDGTDTLINIEMLRFDDGDLPVDTIGGAPDITVSAAQGDEDTAIALSIEVVSNNPFDPVGSITIAGVPDGATLSIGTDSGLTLNGNVLTGSGEGGSFTAADLEALENGAVTITPPADSNEDFDLAVSAETASGVEAAAETLPVTVDAVNDGPVASDSSASGTEDTALSGQLTASDVDGDALTFSLAEGGAPAHGSVTVNPDGSFTYTPDADYNGGDSFTYLVDDGAGGTTTATVSLTIDPENDDPVAVAGVGTLDEDGSLNGQLVASDIDSESLTFGLAEDGGPEHGSVTINPDGSYTYTPDADYNGEDSFTFAVSDGAGGTATQTVSLTVNAVGDAAEASATAASGAEDTVIALDISASVPDSTETVDSITISGVPTGASLSLGTDNGNGSWTLSGTDLDSLGDLTITPPTDDNADFTLSVAATSTDGTTGDAVDLPVTVSAVADTTLSTSDATGDEDTAIALTIAPNVAGGESIASVTISGVPSGATLSAGTDNGNGTWTLSGDDLAGLTITPDTDDNTDFQLGVSVDVTDGDTTHTLTDTVDVTVNAVNDGPVASDSAASGTEDVALNGQLTASDVDGDALTFSLAEGGAPAHGTVTVNADGSFSYTPDADYNGDDSFTYLVDDGAGGTTTATVSLTIDPENDDPVAVAGVGTLDEDGSLNGQLVASDIDSESLTFGLAEDGGPEHGSVTINPDGSYTYTPDADYNGEDSFTFAVSDGAGGTATQTVSLTVNAVGDAAEASATAASGAEDTVIALDISASVPDSTETVDSITISGVPTGASLSLGTDNGDGSWTLSGTDLDSLGDLTITPPTDDNADFTLSVAATSTDGTTGDAVDLPVTVSAVADTTLSTSDATGDEDTAIALTIAPSVAGGESIASVTISGVPSGATLSAGTDNGNGTWTLSGDDLAGLTITPDADDNSDFQLGVSVDVTDGDTTHTLTDTVDVTVNAVNDGPVASDSAASGTEDLALNGQLTASDVDGDALTFSLAEGGAPAHGSVTVNPDGSFTYTPDADYNGGDSFTYLVDDGQGGTTTATVSLTIDPENDDPVAVAGVGTVDEDGSLNGQLVASDIDSESLTFGLAEDGGPEHGSVTINPDGSYTYTPDADYNGEDSFTFAVSDGAGGTATQTVSLTVNAVGDAAEVATESASGAEDSAIALDISASVPDSTETVASITISGVPTGASLSLGTDNGDGSWTLSGTDLDNLGDLTITPPTDDNADFTLSVAATSTDGTTGDAVDLPVTVSAVADTTLSTSDATGDEDTAIALTIAPSVAGGESIASITISGVPAGATLSAGTDNGNGTWTLSEGDLAGLTITPDADDNSDFQLGVSVDVTDGDTTHTLTDTVDVTVNAVNDGPVASDSAASGTEDVALNGQLSASDVDGDSLTFSLAEGGAPAHGSVTVNPDGSFTYTPDADYNGGDSFTYLVDDGAGGTTTATVSLTIDPENDDPVAVAGVGTLDEDGSLNGQLVASDIDSESLTFGLAEDGGPEHGSVTINPDGSYTYTPDADYNGEDSFTFAVSDGAGGTATQTVSLTVNAVGDAAEASATAASGAEDTVIALDISASVPDSTETVDSITISGVPTGASLSLGTDNGDGSWTLSGTDLDSLGDLTITPPTDDNADFTLSVAATSTDGTTGDSVDLPVTVSAVADTTLSTSDATGDEDTAIALAIAPSVAGGESIASVTISGVPSGATLSAGTDNGDGTWTLSGDDLAGLTITPDADDNSDFQLGVSVDVTDGDTTHTLTDTVDVTVNAVNDGPVASDSAASGTEDLALNGQLTASDVDGDALTFSLAEGGAPAHGSVTVNPDGSFTYTPDADYNGGDSFTYLVDDGQGGTTTATVSLTIDPENDDPVAVAGVGTVDEDGSLNGQLVASDIDSESLTFGLAEDGGPEHGSVTINPDGSYTYTPDADYNGEDSFTFAVSDGAGGTATQTVSLTVNAVGDAAEVATESASGAEDSAIALDISASVPDSTETVASITISGVPTGASLSLGTDNGDGSWTLSGTDLDNLGDLTITPPTDDNADFTLSVAATSTDGTTGDAVDLPVTVSAVADTTLSTSDATGDEDTAIALTIAPSVAGGESIASVTISGVPAGATLSAGTDNGNGTWTLSEGDLAGLTITPDADDNSDFQLGVSVDVTDGDTTHTLTDTVDVTVNAVNDGPVASDSAASGTEDVALNGQLSASDVDGDSLTFSLAEGGAPAHGSVTVNPDGSFTYTPDADYNGGDSFTYLVDDGAGGTTTATVSLTIDPENDDPVAVAGVGTLDEDGSLNGQLVASDIDSESLTFGLAEDGGPEHGSVTINPDGSYTYTPDADYNGEDSFTFAVSDGAGGTATQTVSLTVNAVGDAAEASATAASGAEDTVIALDISASVPDSTETVDSITISGVPTGASLSLGTDNGDGSWTLSGTDLDSLGDLTITPPTDDNADFTLSVAATSTDGTTGDSVDLPVTVSAVADTTLSTSDATGDEDTAIALTIAPSVAGGESIASVTISGVPSGATLSAGTDNGNGTWTLSAADLNGLTIKPSLDSDADFSLGVSVEVTDGDTAHTLTGTVGVTVDAVADAPDLSASVGDGTVIEDEPQQPADLDTGLGIDINPDTPVEPGSFDQTGNNGSNTILGYSGDDTIDGRGGKDNLYGDQWQVGNDDGNDVIFGRGGADKILGGGGADEISGGDDDDTIYGDYERGHDNDGNDVIDAGAGDDRVLAGAGDDQVSGGSGDDDIYGDYESSDSESGDDIIDAGAGDDVVRGGGGDDQIAGGSGDDVIFGDFGNIYGSHINAWSTDDDGNDTIDAGAGDDLVVGGTGDDIIAGGTGDDIIYADLTYGTNRDGDDVVAGGAGDDTIYGGGGNDTAVFAGARDEYQIIQNNNGSFTITDLVGGRDGTDTVYNVETFRFSDGDVSSGDLLSGVSGGGGDTGDVGYVIEFPLNIAAGLTDLDGSETLSDITISGVPEGASLSAGTDNGNGSWTLTEDQLSGLKLTVGDEITEDFSLSVSVTSTETSGGSSTTTLSLDIPVSGGPAADLPDLTISLGTGVVTMVEGETPDPVTVFSSTFDVNEGFVDNVQGWGTDSEAIEVWNSESGHTGDGGYVELNDDRVNEYDDAVSINRTFNTVEGQTYTVTFDYSPRPGYDDDVNEFQVRIDGQTLVTLAPDGSSNNDNVWQSHTVTFVGTGEPMNLEFLSTGEAMDYGRGVRLDNIEMTTTPLATEDVAEIEYPLTITAALTDTDGSETLSDITVSGVPEGATLSAGTDNGDGSWTLTQADLEGLTLTVGEDVGSDFTLSASVTSTESVGGDTATATASVEVAADSVMVLSASVGEGETTAGAEPISYFSFDSASNNVVTNEIDGAAAATLKGSSYDQADIVNGGRFGNTADFDGYNDYVEVPHTGDMALDSGSVTLWFNTDNANDKQGLISKDSCGFDTGGHFTVLVEDGEVKVRLQSDDESYWVSGGNLSSNSWHQATVSWGQNGLQLYVDGQLVDSNAYTGGLGGNENPWAIGANAWSTGDNDLNGLKDFFDGQIDDVAIYDRQLSSDEISSLYADGVQAMIDGGEGATEYPLAISADLVFGDADETVAITIDGVPDGASLSAGTDNGNGSWTLSQNQLDGLSMTVGQGTGDFSLAVSATATDAQGNVTASASTSLPFDFNDAPTLGGDGMASVGIGDEVVLTGDDLQLFDDESDAAHLIYELTDDVDFGTLYLSDASGNRVDLDIGDTFTQADIDLGMLSYEQDDSLAHFWDPETPEWSAGGGAVDQSNLTMPLEAEGVTITFQGEEAGYENSLGWYKLDAEGNPTEPQMLWTNTDHHSLSAGTEVTLQGLAPGEQFGFFIIQDGNDDYSWMNSQLQAGNGMQFGQDGSLQFVDGGGNVVGSVNGNDLFYTGSSLNPDGINHAISGVQDGELVIGFEDLTGGGDNDFDDVVFSVKYEGVEGPQTASSDSFTFTAEDGAGATIVDQPDAGEGYTVTDGEAHFDITIDQT